jgi:hypothetical protein
MTWTLDARIPLVIVADAAALDAALASGEAAAVLIEAGGREPDGVIAVERFEAAAAAHPLACGCCSGRGPAALALDRLFQARVRGSTGWFRRVIAVVPTDAGRDEVAAALRGDALTSARFRAAG